MTARWRPMQAGHIHTYRQAIDGLAVGNVIWEPYRDHRQHRAFDDRSWVSGFIRFGSGVSPYLPERVTRQFGYIQSIPGPPPHMLSVDEVDDIWEHWQDHVVDVRDLIPVAEQTPGQCTDDYMPWLVRVSHLWASRASYELHASQYLRQPEVPEDSASLIEHDMREIVTLSQRMLDPIPRGDPQHGWLSRIIALARRHLQNRFARGYQRRVRQKTDEGSST